MQIIIHVVFWNISVYSKSRWQSVFHVPSSIYSTTRQCGSDHGLFQIFELPMCLSVVVGSFLAYQFSML